MKSARLVFFCAAVCVHAVCVGAVIGLAQKAPPKPTPVRTPAAPKPAVSHAAATQDLNAEQQQLFRRVMGRFATGVTVVTTRIDAETFGMTANAFMAGSLEPPLCVVSINRAARMHARLLEAGHYGVSFLSQEQQHLAAHFAGKRFEGLAPEFELRGPTPIV